MNRLAVIIIPAMLSGCAPHSPTVPTQTNVAKGYWPPPRNPPVMVFTNAPMPPSPVRNMAQSVKMFVAVPQTNTPWISNMLWVIHTRCGLDPQDHSRTNLIAVLTACDPEFYYHGMAHGPITFKILGLDPNSFSKGYLNIPSLVRESLDGGLSWHFYKVSTDGTFTVEPTNPAAIYQVEWSLNNVNLIK